MSDQPGSMKALSHKSSSSFGCGCFFSMFFGIMLMVSGMFSFVLYQEFLGPYFDALSWQETPCIITAYNRAGNRTKVEYEYEIDGQKLNSEQFDYLQNTAPPQAAIRKLKQEFPVGAKTVCYVNPDQKFEAVLSKGFRPVSLSALIPLAFVVIALLGLIATPYYSRKLASSSSKLSESPIQIDLTSNFANAFSDKKDWHDPDTTPGPQELKPVDSTWTSFLGCGFFTLFWCGIVSIFVFDTIQQWIDGQRPFLQTLFMLPFVAVGAGGIVVTIMYFLKLFNPVPKLLVSERVIPLGDSIRIKWVMDGNTSSIKKLTVKLLGEEWIQYQRGTSTYTETNLFYEEVLANEFAQDRIEVGETTANIPADSMHTFHANSNKIRWKLQVLGEIAFWPDVDASYAITVLPQAVLPPVEEVSEE